eukprot:scaffold1205_cov203-Chaetoceros_neogracile.AAC.1
MIVEWRRRWSNWHQTQAIHHVDGLVEACRASSGKGALKATRYQEINSDGRSSRSKGTDMGENATAAAVLTQEGREEQDERAHSSDEDSGEEDPYVSTHFNGQLPAANGAVAKA